MGDLTQRFARRLPWFNLRRLGIGLFATALLIVFLFPNAHRVAQFVTIAGVIGAAAAILCGLTFWPKARVRMSRFLNARNLKFQYKVARRNAALVALVGLSFLLVRVAAGGVSAGGNSNPTVTVAISMPTNFRMLRPGDKPPPNSWASAASYNSPGQAHWFVSYSPSHSDVFVKASEFDHINQQPLDWKLQYQVESGTTSHVRALAALDGLRVSAQKECPQTVSFHVISETRGGPREVLRNNLESWSEITFEEVTIGCPGFPDTDRLSRILLFSSDWSTVHHPVFNFSYVVKGKAMTPEQHEEGMKLIQSHSPLSPIPAGVPSVVATFDRNQSGPQAVGFELPGTR